VSGTRCSTLYLCDERRSPNPTAAREKVTRPRRLEVGDQAAVEHLVGEVVAAAAQVLHVAVVDLFGGDLDGLVPVGFQRIAPERERLDVVGRSESASGTIKPASWPRSTIISVVGSRPPGNISVTITNDVAKAVSDIKGGRINFRVDKQANLHLIIGKASFDEKRLAENYGAAIDEVLRAKPSTSKGRYLKKVTMSTTTDPGIPVDPTVTRNFAEV
jgi:hypothetical protein